MLLAISLGLYVTVTAQNSTVTLYSLIQQFTPGEANPSLSADWKTGTSSLVKWQNSAPKKTPIGYLKSGTAPVVLQKQTVCSIDLSGSTLAGYTEISLTIKPPKAKDGSYAYDAKTLFGSMASQATLIKKDDGGFPMYYYRLNIPGKKPLWLIIMLDSGGSHAREDDAMVNIICLTDKKEFDKRMAY